MKVDFLSRMSGDIGKFTSQGFTRDKDAGSGIRSDGISPEGQDLAKPDNGQAALGSLDDLGFDAEFFKACDVLSLDLRGVIKTITDPSENLLPSVNQEQVSLLVSDLRKDIPITISLEEAETLATKIETRFEIKHEKIDVQALADCKSVQAVATLVLETKLKDIDASYPTVTPEFYPSNSHN